MGKDRISNVRDLKNGEGIHTDPRRMGYKGSPPGTAQGRFWEETIDLPSKGENRGMKAEDPRAFSERGY